MNKFKSNISANQKAAPAVRTLADSPDAIKTQLAKNLIKRDKFLTLSEYSSKHSRDVSYILDQRKLSPLPTPVILPKDLTHLKKLYESSKKAGIPTMSSAQNNHTCNCRKETCLETVLNIRSSSLDRDKNKCSGHPSGRHEAISLKDWFQNMQSLHMQDLNTGDL